MGLSVAISVSAAGQIYMTREGIIKIIENDAWMMDSLHVVKKLNLPDWWIGAGFVRSKVWDTLHGYKKRTPLPDIDVIYLDKNDFSVEEASQETTKQEIKYEKLLKKLTPETNWSVTNQARMHVFHKDKPYKSSEKALAQWVETATCIGVRLDSRNNIVLATPRGIDDLVNLILRPIPDSYEDLSIFISRVQKKEWLKKWPKLKIITSKS